MVSHRIVSNAIFTVTRAGKKIELSVAGSGHYDPGRTCGRPEDCYEPEGEMMITSVTAVDEQGRPRPWMGELSDDEYDSVIDMLWDRASAFEDNEYDF